MDGSMRPKIYVKHKSDLNLLIDNHFDTSLGPLTDKESSQRILAKISEQPEDVIFITKSAEEAKVAKETRITSILVVTHRRNIEKFGRIRQTNDKNSIIE
jgi:methionine salvage enolase-phosphatase E1